MFKVLLTRAIVYICVMEFSWASPVPKREVKDLCQAKSEQMLKYLNNSVDPCDNFYEFACGNYAKYYPATKSRPGTHVLTYAKEDMEAKISDLLTDKEHDESIDEKDNEVWQKAKDFYKSCLNAKSLLADIYPQKLRAIIAEFGQMPVLEGDNWQEDGFDWLQTIAEISHKYDIDIIVGYYVSNDLVTNIRNRLHFGHQAFTFQSSSLLLDDAYEKYRLTYKRSIAATLLLTLELDPEVAVNTANEIYEFDISLAKGLGEFSPGVREPIRRHASADTMNHMYSFFGLDTNKILEIRLGYRPNTSDIELIEVTPNYQINLINVLRTTPKRVIANYIFYKLISRFPLIDPSQCEEVTISHFSKFLSHKLYHYYNMSQSAQYVQNMFQSLKSTFQKTLESPKYSWISENTRKLAVDKLLAMKMIIQSHDDVDFSKEYGQISIDAGDYIENLKSIYMSDGLKSRAMFTNPPKYYDDEKAFGYSPVYILPDNIVRFPLSNLLPHHLFSTAYPQAINFGSMGFLIGHEILHGFDDEGRKIDIYGIQKDWWDKESAKVYEDRTNCFIDQYHRYTYEGHQLPRRVLQSENIADNGGIRLAYAAYLEWYTNALDSQNEMALKETLPQVSFSNRQLFFISMAQSWCSDVLKESRIAYMAADEHMPDGVRIVGALSNFEEFSKEFKCPKGSGMNPAEKCQIF